MSSNRSARQRVCREIPRKAFVINSRVSLVAVIKCSMSFYFIGFYIRGKSRFFRNFTAVLQVTRCKVRNFLRHIKIFSQLFTSMNENLDNHSNTIHQRIAQIVKHFAADNNSLAAKNLGVSEGTIRSYRNGTTPKADVLEKIVRTYDVNAMWLLTGVGEMCAPNQSMADNVRISGDTSLVEFFKQFDPLLQQRDDKLLRQAEEIGRLREQLEQARHTIERLEAGKNVSTTHHAPKPAPVVP